MQDQFGLTEAVMQKLNGRIDSAYVQERMKKLTDGDSIQMTSTGYAVALESGATLTGTREAVVNHLAASIEGSAPAGFRTSAGQDGVWDKMREQAVARVHRQSGETTEIKNRRAALLPRG